MEATVAPSKCYNPECEELLGEEKPRKGWRLRPGDLALLCDRCGSIYEEGKFCETFHPNASGWRCCESCGKRVHCGCIVSVHAFALLDPGGIECSSCAQRSCILTPSTAWPHAVFHSPLPDRLKEHPGKTWSHMAGSGPVPWRQAPSLFNTSVSRPELQERASISFEVDPANSTYRFIRTIASPSMDSKKSKGCSERFMKLSAAEKFENGSAGQGKENCLIQCISNPQQSASIKGELANPLFGLSVPYASGTELNGHSSPHFRPAPPPTLSKQFFGSTPSNSISLGEAQARNGRPQADARGRNNFLSRYCPRATDQELQRISGDSKLAITPLFEKMLSASDAGKIGRLVLPKKCAEAYFPAISQPEGLPLKVQDAKGSEWIFQFRFWPNNNSRMYVLEGVTPCIQSMHLQAGDTVTFSRLEPDGKLIMGFRKASAAPPSDQDNDAAKASNRLSIQDAESADPGPWSKVYKSGYIAKGAVGMKSSVARNRKRKANVLALKSKYLRADAEELIELKITWEEAQGLLRPPLDHQPTVVVIEGFVFEEYEDAPVIGKPTIYVANGVDKKSQWVQCEDCSKWHGIPADAPLPSRWTCAANKLDSERSSCALPQELSTEELEDLFNASTSASKKKKAPPKDTDSIEAPEALASLAVLEEDESIPSLSSQATTSKHPRHRPGCTCIVCIQPPSGKGPKHKSSCVCNVCMTVKRRFRTLAMRREKKQTEKEGDESSPKKLPKQSQEKYQEDEPCNISNDHTSTSGDGQGQKGTLPVGSDEDHRKEKLPLGLPFKGQFDLNMQPDKEEEVSPGLDPKPTPGVVNRDCKEEPCDIVGGSSLSGDRIGRK